MSGHANPLADHVQDHPVTEQDIIFALIVYDLSALYRFAGIVQIYLYLSLPPKIWTSNTSLGQNAGSRDSLSMPKLAGTSGSRCTKYQLR